jgi:hypothetical protein
LKKCEKNNKIQTDKNSEKNVRKATKYKQIKTLKKCEKNNKIQTDKNIERVQERPKKKTILN